MMPRRAQHVMPSRGNMRAEFLYTGSWAALAGFKRGNADQPMAYCIIGTQKCPMSIWRFAALGPRGWQTLAAPRVIFAAAWLNCSHGGAYC